MAWLCSWIGDGVMSVKDIIQAAAGVGGGGGVEPPDVSWDLDYAYYDLQGNLAWNLSNLTYTNFFKNIINEEFGPNGVFAKPDGTKVYVIGLDGDEINEYNLSTPWKIDTAVYFQKFSISAQELSAEELFFKPDGSKVYICGGNSSSIHEYSLSTPWSVASCTYVQSLSVSAIDGTPRGLFFKSDGTKIYYAGGNTHSVIELNLSTPWNISTASFFQSFSVVSQELAIEAVFFKTDGTQMYVLGSNGDDINIYNLSTPWSVSSASYSAVVSVSAQDGLPTGLFIHNGGIVLIAGYLNRYIFQYYIPGYTLTQLGTNPANVITFSTDGTKMYTTNNQSSAETYQYTLTTPWDTSTAVYDNKAYSFGYVTQGIFWKPDGTRLFICTTNPDSIRVYNVSTPWDIQAVTGIGGYGIAQDSNPYDVFFKDDGTRMYVVGMSNDKVYEYSLSTAWNPLGGSAVFVRDFSVVAQDTVPSGLFFKPDGTKMYVTGTGSAFVNEYDLATPWNISTASYSKRIYVGFAEPSPNAFYFKPEGDRFYVVGSRRTIGSYAIGIQG